MLHLVLQRMHKQINLLGGIALALFAASAVPSLAWLSLPGLILLMYLYLQIDKLGFGSKLFRISLIQLIPMIPAMGFLAYINLDKSALTNSSVFTYLSIAVVVALLLFLTYTTYLVAMNLLTLGENSDNLSFKISGVLTKIGAFTMPLMGLGLLFLVLAQPIFLLGCIMYKEVGVLNKCLN